MAEENGLDGDINKEKATVSTSNSPLLDNGIPSDKGKNMKLLYQGKANKRNSNKVPSSKLFSFADSLDNLLAVIGFISAVGNGILFALRSILFGEVIDSFFQTEGTNNVVGAVSKVCLKFVYLAIGSGIVSSIQMACWMVTGERQAARIRRLYLKTVLRQDFRFLDKEVNTGEVVERMSGDIDLIQDAISEKFGKSIQLVTTVLAGYIIASVEGWRLFLVILLSILLYAVSVYTTILICMKTELVSRGQNAYSLAATVVEQTICSMRTVASFTGEKQAIDTYNNCLTEAYNSGVQERVAFGLGFGSARLLCFCIYALVFWCGGIVIQEYGYTGGQAITVIFAVFGCVLRSGRLSTWNASTEAGQAAAYKMFEAINSNPEIDAHDTNGLKLDDIRGDIELRDIYFSYPARPHIKILNGFSLALPSGTTATLVGHSGCGKSTVISLIERFYDPQAGEVLIDGINIKEFQLKWIREKIGLVSQEPVLFGTSIKENIAYGKDGATTEEIKTAIELSNAAKFIDKLPQGLDTVVGEHGPPLSGCQKQRVAIARAILKDPRILLLDEATSDLNAESERVVQEALDRVMIKRTTIIIAHRLSSVRNADIIAVIHRGKIVEKGSHTDLVKDPDGAYSQLIRLTEQTVKHDIPPSNPSKKPPEVPLSRLAYLNKPENSAILLGIVASFVEGAISPMTAILLSNVIKTFNEPTHELMKNIEFWAIGFIILGLLSSLAIAVRSYFLDVAGSKLINRIRSMCFEKVAHMEISWFDEASHSSDAIGSLLSSDAASIKDLVGDARSRSVQVTATTVFGLSIAFKANWQFALMILAMFLLLEVNGYVQAKSRKGFSTNAKKMYEEGSEVADDAVGSIRTVNSLCAGEKVMELYQKKCEGPMKSRISLGLINGIGFGLSNFLLFSFYACCVYVAAQLIEAREMTSAQGFLVFLAVTKTFVGFYVPGSMVPDVVKAERSAASVFALINRDSRIDSSDESGETIENLKGDIEFSRVSFFYPTRPDLQIFRDSSFSIRSGTTVALVGESGSGKSTVISLLQRFYDPDSGQIMVDGFEIQKLKLKWLRQKMGLVSQEPVLFNDTIRANIAYGKEGNATEAEIIAAAQLANANKFISSLQEGYNTMVGESGIQLSCGQYQRVSIARAIMKSPKILLLDEATSALDAESERVVQDALDQVMVGRTNVVVAHRLSTIKGADLILVLKNGVIAEKGKHDSLMNTKNGVYASLVASDARASS